jgi:hypothetical protein
MEGSSSSGKQPSSESDNAVSFPNTALVNNDLRVTDKLYSAAQNGVPSSDVPLLQLNASVMTPMPFHEVKSAEEQT